MDIILDKSFLRGARAHQLHAVLEMHDAFMPDVLFYEIFKDDEHRQRLFGRLPARPNPVKLLPGCGEILRYEIEHRRSAMPIGQHVLVENYQFNPALANGTAHIDQWMRTATADQAVSYRESAEGMAELAAIIPSMFPWISSHRPGRRNLLSQFTAVEDRIGRDDGAIRMLYTQVRHPTWPGASFVKRNTALFRKIQVDCLFALTIFKQHGGSPSENAIRNSIEHDARDRDYALFATLSGAIATRDEPLARIIRCAEPRTIIVGLGYWPPRVRN